MVIEWLTFDIEPEIRDRWMEVEEVNWSRYLEQRPGFISKQLWVDQSNPGQIHAVITWTDEETWLTVPAEDIVRVDAAMGDLLRNCTMRVFDVIRDC